MPRLPPLTLFLLGLGATPTWGFDPSEYRQNTYGAPTHYCDPTRSLASNGAGTAAAPWNMSQCATQPVAGNVVGILPGLSVPLPTTSNDNIPAFNPSNSGTSTSRIVYVTKFAAVALANPETNTHRTEFRHDGSAPSIVNGVGAGTGCPMLGAYHRDHITYDGFYIDMAHAYMSEDSGVIRPDTATGILFKNFVIKGANLTVASNPVIYRPHNALNTVLSNFRAYDFDNDGTGSITPQNALFSDQYGDENFLIEHFEIRNTERGIFLKGSAGPNNALNYGTIQYGVVSDVSSCYQFNALSTTNLTTVQYALCYSTAQGGGVVMSSETSPARNLTIDHVTVARVDAASINTEGGIITRSNGIAANVTITNSLVDGDNGAFGHAVSLGNTLPATLNYNGYYKNGAPISYVFNGMQYNSFASWQAAISGRDAASFELSSGPFVNRAGGDFHITAGHPAKTASSTGAEIGPYGGTRAVGVDLSGAAVDQISPSAPGGLTVE